MTCHVCYDSFIFFCRITFHECFLLSDFFSAKSVSRYITKKMKTHSSGCEKLQLFLQIFCFWCATSTDSFHHLSFSGNKKKKNCIWTMKTHSRTNTSHKKKTTNMATYTTRILCGDPNTFPRFQHQSWAQQTTTKNPNTKNTGQYVPILHVVRLMWWCSTSLFRCFACDAVDIFCKPPSSQSPFSNQNHQNHHCHQCVCVHVVLMWVK